jgi:hypothetical protein
MAFVDGFARFRITGRGQGRRGDRAETPNGPETEQQADDQPSHSHKCPNRIQFISFLWKNDVAQVVQELTNVQNGQGLLVANSYR